MVGKIRFFAGLLVLLASQVHAGWVLDSDTSKLNFSFTKNTHLVTTATFNNLYGSISDKRVARVEISLNSLYSGIEKRDSRLKDLFFQTRKFPVAEVEMKLYNRTLKKIQKDKRTTMNISFYLTMNGVKRRMDADVFINLDDDGEINILTVNPVMVEANKFGYTEEVEVLVRLAGVKNISYVVPVTFHLRFVPTKKAS